MKAPLQITLRNIEATEAIENRIHKKRINSINILIKLFLLIL